MTINSNPFLSKIIFITLSFYDFKPIPRQLHLMTFCCAYESVFFSMDFRTEFHSIFEKLYFFSSLLIKGLVLLRFSLIFEYQPVKKVLEFFSFSPRSMPSSFPTPLILVTFPLEDIFVVLAY